MNAFARPLFTIICVGWTTIAIQCSQAEEVRLLNINAKTISYVPGKGIETYRQSTEGNVGIGSTVGLGVPIDSEEIMMQYTGKKRDDRIFADVTLRREDQEDERFEVELSDMKPQSIDVGVSKDGRHHFVTFTPSVLVVETEPKSLAKEALGFSVWQFLNSPVIVNDAIYVGRLGGSGDFATFEITDIASIAIVLEETEGWMPWGTLNDGVVTIRHPEEKTTIEILNVQNGSSGDSLTLPGGPYRVWVKWDEPTGTSAEVWKQAREYRQRVIADGVDPEDPRVALFDKLLAREPSPWIFGSGFHDRKVSPFIKR